MGPGGSSQPHGRLLIVDDLEVNRVLLCRMFGMHGYETVEAAGGVPCLELLERETFDLVLLDVMMPDLDGREVLRRIRERHTASELPVIMVTALTETHEVVAALRLGANDYLTKPVDFAVALARTEAQIARKRAEGALREAHAELHAMERQRREDAERAHQSQKMQALGQLAGGVAHEFNNLLLVIGGYAGIARNRVAGDAETAAAVDQILSASGRAAELAGQMLTFSRSWIGEHEVVEVGGALDGLTRLIGPAAQGVRLEIDCDPDLRVEISQTHLTQALLNLVLNARDAMPRGGRVAIAARRRQLAEPHRTHGADRPLPPGAYVELTVADEGSGMDPDVVARVFEPFFTTKPVGLGTGLGLSFVFGVLNNAGGGVEVESRPGEGTTFHLLLPASDRAATVRPAAPAATAGGMAQTVLLVDDEPAARAVTARMLEGLGCRVIEAAGGEAAISLFADHVGEIDLVLTDVLMPDLDGFDLALILQELGCAAPIGFMTGCVPDLEADARWAVRPELLLNKPFDPSALGAFLRRMSQGKLAA